MIRLIINLLWPRVGAFGQSALLPSRTQDHPQSVAKSDHSKCTYIIVDHLPDFAAFLRLGLHQVPLFDHEIGALVTSA